MFLQGSKGERKDVFALILHRADRPESPNVAVSVAKQIALHETVALLLRDGWQFLDESINLRVIVDQAQWRTLEVSFVVST